MAAPEEKRFTLAECRVEIAALLEVGQRRFGGQAGIEHNKD